MLGSGSMIRHIQLKDKEQWEELYKGYADFYKVEMNNNILQTVWNWLHDKNHEVKGLVYEVDGNIIGLAHYRRMPSPLRGQDIGFLDDLFVDPKYRGQKIGEITKPIILSNGILVLKLMNTKKSEIAINVENEVKKAIIYERNRQLNQYSKIYFNKIKKNLDFNG